MSVYSQNLPLAPVLMPYSQYVQGIKPSFTMWAGFSTFALVFECLRQFTEFRINENGTLEMIIEKKELAAKVKQFEEQQAQWSAAKERMQQEKLKQEQRLKQIESEAERALAAQKQSEAQKLQEKLPTESQAIHRPSASGTAIEFGARIKQYKTPTGIDEQIITIFDNQTGRLPCTYSIKSQK